MIHIKDHKQREIFDPWDFLSPKRRRMLDETWPGLFREHVLEELPVNEMRPFFHEYFGRPSKEIHTVLGIMLLQQTMDLSDKEAIGHLAYDIRWHYALGITDESDKAKYISEKTLWSTRQTMASHNLDQVMLNKIAGKLADVFEVDTENQRIDSVHIQSNMRRLGRVGIFSKTIHKFLVNLKRHHTELFDTIPEELRQRYISEKSLQSFSMVKPSQAEKTLQTLSADLFDLIERFKDRPEVCSMHSYKLMQRVLCEQCNVVSDDKGDHVTVKKPKEIPSDSLQNPSDPDASFSGHKGQGYQVQIMETYTSTDDRDEKDQTLNLITSVEVEKACEHDSGALLPAIEAAQNQDLSPETVLADSLYGGDDNVQAAKALGVDVIAPAMPGGQSEGIRLDAFQFNKQGRVVACPAGHAPEQVKYKKKNQRHTACFALDHCAACPLAGQCPVNSGKKYNYLRYTDKEWRLAERRAVEKTEAFVDAYRWRAGVEATMSQYDRLTGVKRLRVRGLQAVRFCATLKAAGLNLLRAAAVRIARGRATAPENDCFSPQNGVYLFFKERFRSILSFESKGFASGSMADENYLKVAA
ncbi:MAG: transposase [bacterium]|nr:transposase [bacterium]